MIEQYEEMDVKQNPGIEDILLPVVLVGGAVFAVWKFGLLHKLGILKKKEEEESEIITTATGVKTNYNVKVPTLAGIRIPLGSKSDLCSIAYIYIKKNKGNIAALQHGLNKHYGVGLTEDADWGTATLKALMYAVGKEKNSCKVYKKIGMKFVGKKGVAMSVGRRIIICPGSKIRSRGLGRGLGTGRRRGPLGVPLYQKFRKYRPSYKYRGVYGKGLGRGRGAGPIGIPYYIDSKPRIAKTDLFYSTKEDTRFEQ